MTILFGGGEIGAFVPSDSAVSEQALHYNSSFARTSIHCPRDTNYAEALPSAAGTDIWIHFDMVSDSIASGTSTTRFVWYDSSGNERIKINYTGNTNTVIVQYWNGASFTSLTAVSLNMSLVRQTLDLHVVCNSASGSINLYVSGTNRLNSGAINLSSVADLKKFRFYGSAPSGLTTDTWVSQVIVADESTIGWRLATFYPNGAGATSSWTGAFTDIDEATYNDADFINSATANQVSTFAQTGPAMTGYVVKAVIVAARAKRGSSGPANLQLTLRSAGTDYFSASHALDLGYTGEQNAWETNPATGAAWVNTAISSLQPGVKSIT
jgi:hypothetical protein